MLAFFDCVRCTGVSSCASVVFVPLCTYFVIVPRLNAGLRDHCTGQRQRVCWRMVATAASCGHCIVILRIVAPEQLLRRQVCMCARMQMCGAFPMLLPVPVWAQRVVGVFEDELYPYCCACRSPKSFVVLACNDGVSWTVVDSQSGVTSWASGTNMTFTLASTSGACVCSCPVTDTCLARGRACSSVSLHPIAIFFAPKISPQWKGLLVIVTRLFLQATTRTGAWLRQACCAPTAIRRYHCRSGACSHPVRHSARRQQCL